MMSCTADNTTIIWCKTCGCYAGIKGKGLASACPGPPTKAADGKRGGREGQLRKLNSGRHPVLGAGKTVIHFVGEPLREFAREPVVTGTLGNSSTSCDRASWGSSGAKITLANLPLDPTLCGHAKLSERDLTTLRLHGYSIVTDGLIKRTNGPTLTMGMARAEALKLRVLERISAPNCGRIVVQVAAPIRESSDREVVCTVVAKKRRMNVTTTP